MRLLLCATILALGCDQSPIELGRKIGVQGDGQDAGVDAAPVYLSGLVTNSASIAAPQLEAAFIWPVVGGMMPVTYGASAASPVSGSPASFTIDLSNAIPDNIFAIYSANNLHAIDCHPGVIRSGSVFQSGVNEFVAACDVWGFADLALYYFIQPGSWLSSQYGDPTYYSQGWHLFSITSTVPDGGMCMNPMCGGTIFQVEEVPLQTQLVIDLRSPSTWCN